jgi:hypothetical protein
MIEKTNIYSNTWHTRSCEIITVKINIDINSLNNVNGFPGSIGRGSLYFIEPWQYLPEIQKEHPGKIRHGGRI